MKFKCDPLPTATIGWRAERAARKAEGTRRSILTRNKYGVLHDATKSLIAKPVDHTCKMSGKKISSIVVNGLVC
jgi:hypothetical protein